MDVKTWTYLIVGITFVAYIGIAIWSKAKSTKEFYVAGGGVGICPTAFSDRTEAAQYRDHHGR